MFVITFKHRPVIHAIHLFAGGAGIAGDEQVDAGALGQHTPTPGTWQQAPETCTRLYHANALAKMSKLIPVQYQRPTFPALVSGAAPARGDKVVVNWGGSICRATFVQVMATGKAKVCLEEENPGAIVTVDEFLPYGAGCEMTLYDLRASRLRSHHAHLAHVKLTGGLNVSAAAASDLFNHYDPTYYDNASVNCKIPLNIKTL